MSKAEETKLTLRAPSDLIEVLRLLSDLHDRSLNGEIVRALREYAENHVNEWGNTSTRANARKVTKGVPQDER